MYSLDSTILLIKIKPTILGTYEKLFPHHCEEHFKFNRDAIGFLFFNRNFNEIEEIEVRLT